MRTEEGLVLRLRQEAMRADKLMRPCAGRFVAGEEQGAARAAAREAGVAVSFDGGWAGCERVQACFHPPEDDPVYTHVWLEIRWNSKFAAVSHSDLMGSLMALGIDRSYFGDLIAGDGQAWLCALPEVARRLPMEWDKAGRTTITVRELEEAPALEPPKGTLLRDTVPSTRLDCLLASGMKTSRSKAAEIIRQGLVMVDHQAEERVDKVLTAGQLISVRHFGRIRLQEIGSPTRKDRLPVVLEIFGK